jgi:hypothetical protein
MKKLMLLCMLAVSVTPSTFADPSEKQKENKEQKESQEHPASPRPIPRPLVAQPRPAASPTPAGSREVSPEFNALPAAAIAAMQPAVLVNMHIQGDVQFVLPNAARVANNFDVRFNNFGLEDNHQEPVQQPRVGRSLLQMPSAPAVAAHAQIQPISPRDLLRIGAREHVPQAPASSSVLELETAVWQNGQAALFAAAHNQSKYHNPRLNP